MDTGHRYSVSKGPAPACVCQALGIMGSALPQGLYRGNKPQSHNRHKTNKSRMRRVRARGERGRAGCLAIEECGPRFS